MSAALRFGDLEFVVLWESSTGERLPAPLVFTSRTPMYYDFLREKREVAAQLRAKWDRSHAELVEVITQPDLRITVNGYNGSGGVDARIRMIALRRGSRGYLIGQLPAETVDHSAGFTVTECDPVLLANDVVAALPEGGAGRQTQVTLANADEADAMDPEFGHSLISDIRDGSTSHRSAKFLNTPVTCFGTVEVVQGHSKFGPRGITARRLEWRDLRDDGRYIISGEPPQAAIAADSKRMIAAINARVAEVVQTIREERAL